MKKTRLLFATVMGLLMYLMALNAQSFTIPSNLNQDISIIPMVFQGEVLSVDIYLGDLYGNRLPYGIDKLPDGSPAKTYSSAIINVCKSYKGTLQNGTVEMVTQGNWRAYYASTENNELELRYYKDPSTGHGEIFSLSPQNIGNRFVFFANQSQFNRATGAQCTNTTQIELFKNDYFIYYNDAWFTMMKNHHTKGYVIDPTAKDGYAFGFGNQYKNEFEITSFLESLNLSTSDENSCTSWEEIIQSMPPYQFDGTADDIPYELRLENYNEWLQKAQEKISKMRVRDVNASGLILEMVNPRLAGTPSEYYLEFDIMISATDNVTWFDNCLMRLQYNAGAFGTNIAANNNITITRGPLYSSTTYTEPQFDVADITTNVVAIPFGTDFNAGAWNRTQVTIFPELLMTIRFTIQTCSQLSDIFFTDQSLTSNFSFYTVNANDDFFASVSYDNTSYNGTINDPMCEPMIFGFTDGVSAGTNDIITINGRYFGTSKFDGNVMFKNAHRGNIYVPTTYNNSGGLDYYDIVSWQDDEIQLRLPGVIDSVTSLITDVHYAACPGSGKFKVKNYTQTYKETNSPITIPFAINQSINLTPFQKRKISLTGPDVAGSGNQGYVMHCTPDVELTYPGAKALIVKAMRDWSCVSGINFILGPDMAGLPGDDNTSLITLSTLPGGVVMRTDVNVEPCNTGIPNFYLRSFDIEIGSQNWNLDSLGDVLASEVDFYASMAHELGHGHMILHINDSLSDLMFWTDAAVFTPEISRKRVWTSSGSMAGSTWVMNNYILDVTTCLPLHVAYTPGDCTGIWVEEEGANEHYLSVWPNPTAENGHISIGFNLDEDAQTQFFLYDVLGQLVRMTETEFTAGKVVYQLPVNDLAAGTYMIIVRINDKNYAARFIKTM